MRVNHIPIALLLAAGLPSSGLAAAGRPAPVLAQEDFDKLTHALRGEPPRPMKVRLQAALILGRSGGATAVPPLLECLAGDKDAPVRAACAMALGSTGDARAIEPLVAHLEDHELVRQEARKALTRFVRPDALPQLKAARERGNPAVRLLVAEIVTQIKDPAAAPLLAELLGDSDPKARELATAALKALPPEVAETLLLDALEHKDPQVRLEAARTLGERKQVTALPKLVEHAASAQEAADVRKACRSALKEMAAVCERLLRGDDPASRGLAAQALGEIGDAHGLEALRKARAEVKDEKLSKVIAAAIQKLERAGASQQDVHP